MSKLVRLHLFSVALMSALLLLGCMPIRPIVKDQAGRELPLLNELVASAEVVAQAGESFTLPWDATPDANGEWIYFTAATAAGGAVLRVPAAGGEVTVVASGAPLVTPQGLTISTTGDRIYVADPSAPGDTGQVGQIWQVTIATGEVTPLTGATGTAPHNLTLASEAGQEVIYFAGVDPTDGQAALLKLAMDSGAALTVLYKGAPLVAPEGIAVTQAGVVYVADRAAGGEDSGKVFRWQEGKLEAIADHFRPGQFVGAALTADDGGLLISTLEPRSATAQVLVINLASLETGIINAVIGANQGSGGIHRAAAGATFAWADLTDGHKGKVYKVSPP
ncbi:MAG: hypothetical protein R3C14_53350 [Caldilineaceae bacterium]